MLSHPQEQPVWGSLPGSPRPGFLCLVEVKKQEGGGESPKTTLLEKTALRTSSLPRGVFLRHEDKHRLLFFLQKS